MKRFALLFILLLPLASQLYAKDDLTAIVLRDKGGNHSEYYPPADLPEVYYDADNLEIVLVADGFANFYDVEITLTTGYVPLISTQVDGYGDIIDVSLLPEGYYNITITSSNNNQYVGIFSIE